MNTQTLNSGSELFVSDKKNYVKLDNICSIQLTMDRKKAIIEASPSDDEIFEDGGAFCWLTKNDMAIFLNHIHDIYEKMVDGGGNELR